MSNMSQHNIKLPLTFALLLLPSSPKMMPVEFDFPFPVFPFPVFPDFPSTPRTDIFLPDLPFPESGGGGDGNRSPLPLPDLNSPEPENLSISPLPLTALRFSAPSVVSGPSVIEALIPMLSDVSESLLPLLASTATVATSATQSVTDVIKVMIQTL